MGIYVDLSKGGEDEDGLEDLFSPNYKGKNKEEEDDGLPDLFAVDYSQPQVPEKKPGAFITPEKTIDSTTKDVVGGVLETGFSMVGAAALETGAGLTMLWKGLADKATPNYEGKVHPDYEQIHEDFMKLVPEPGTETGKGISNSLAYFAKFLDTLSSGAGDIAFETTDSPAAGAAAKTGVEYLLPIVIAGPIGLMATRGAKLVGWGAKKIPQVASAEARAAAAQEIVSSNINHIVGDSDMLGNAVALNEQMKAKFGPEFSLDLAAATDNPVAAIRKLQLLREDGRFLQESMRQTEANEKAVNKFLSDNFTPDDKLTKAIVSRAKGNLQAIEEASSLHRMALDEQLNAQLERLNRAKLDPDAGDTEAVRGEVTRSVVESRYEAARLEGKIKYEKVGNVELTSAPLFNTLRELNKVSKDLPDNVIPSSFGFFKETLGKYSKGMSQPLEKSMIVDARGNPISTARLPDDIRGIKSKDAIELEQAISREKRALLRAENSNNDYARKKLQFLDSMDQSVKSVLHELDTHPDISVRNAYTDAKNHWRDEVSVYYSDVYGDLLEAKVPGRKDSGYKLASEKVYSTISKDSNTMSKFVKRFGDSPEVMDELSDYFYRQYSKHAFKGNTKEFNQAAANKWLEDNKSVLAAMDGGVFYNDFVGTTADLVTAQNKTAQMARKQKVRETYGLTKALETADLGAVIKAAIKEPKDMSRLVNMTPKHLRPVLSEAVGSHILEKHSKFSSNGLRKVDYTNLYDDLVQNEKNLSKAMSQEHIQDLKTVADYYRRQEATRTPITGQYKKEDIDPLKAYTDLSSRSLMNLVRAHNQGRTGPVDVAGQVVGGLITKLYRENVYALEMKAYTDPKVAKAMADLARNEGKTLGTKSALNLVDALDEMGRNIPESVWKARGSFVKAGIVQGAAAGGRGVPYYEDVSWRQGPPMGVEER